MHEIFLLYNAARPTLGPTLPHTQWISGAPSPVIRRLGHTAGWTLFSAVVMNGAILPLNHMPSWHALKQFYLVLMLQTVVWFKYFSSTWKYWRERHGSTQNKATTPWMFRPWSGHYTNYIIPAPDMKHSISLHQILHTESHYIKEIYSPYILEYLQTFSWSKYFYYKERLEWDIIF